MLDLGGASKAKWTIVAKGELQDPHDSRTIVHLIYHRVPGHPVHGRTTIVHPYPSSIPWPWLMIPISWCTRGHSSAKYSSKAQATLDLVSSPSAHACPANPPPPPPRSHWGPFGPLTWGGTARLHGGHENMFPQARCVPDSKRV